MSSVLAAPVIIVGGGIGGLAAALSLASRGRRVMSWSELPSSRRSVPGIQLAPNATPRPERVGLLEPVLSEAVRPVRAVMMEASTGDHLAELDFGEHFQTTFGAPYVVTHRSDLLTALLKACLASDLITLENSRRVVGLKERGDKVLITCEDGSRYSARLVIGADGLRSACREYVLVTAHRCAAVTSHIAARCLSPLRGM